jgi:transposase
MNETFKLHCDNTPAHTEFSVREYLAKSCSHVLPQAPYSPDLPPFDFYLFTKLKSRVKGYHFQTVHHVQEGCNQCQQHTNKS